MRVLTGVDAPPVARLAPAHRRAVWDWRATRRMRKLLSGWDPSSAPGWSAQEVGDALFRQMYTAAYLDEWESHACPQPRGELRELKVNIVSRAA